MLFTTILVGTLDVATGVKVSLDDKKATVKVLHPHLEKDRNSWAVQSLGSPIASIAASLLAEALSKPVVVKKEEQHRGENSIELEILNKEKKSEDI